MLKINTKWFQYDNTRETVTDRGMYEARLKEIRSKMRVRYLTVFGIFVLLVLLVSKTSGDTTFVQQITFGSTLVSLVLAVLAIAVSARKEVRAEALRNELEERAARLEAATSRLQEAVLQAERYSQSLRSQAEQGQWAERPDKAARKPETETVPALEEAKKTAADLGIGIGAKAADGAPEPVLREDKPEDSGKLHIEK